MILPRCYHYFAFRVSRRGMYDERLPDGGVVVWAWTELAAIEKAFIEGYRHLPCKQGEMVVLIEVRDKDRCRQALLMQQDWERAYRKFEELMTVS